MWPRVQGLRALELATPGPLRDELTALVLAGRKRATAGRFAEYAEEGEELETVGERLALLDSDGKSLGVVEVTALEIVKFADVTWDFADSEGEGFVTIEHWREAHRGYWASEGTPVDDGSDIACLSFRLVDATT